MAKDDPSLGDQLLESVTDAMVAAASGYREDPLPGLATDTSLELT